MWKFTIVVQYNSERLSLLYLLVFMEEDNPGLPRWAQEPDEASPLYSEGGRGRGVRRAYEDADEEEEEGSYRQVRGHGHSTIIFPFSYVNSPPL
jgi:hypothetical protein